MSTTKTLLTLMSLPITPATAVRAVHRIADPTYTTLGPDVRNALRLSKRPAVLARAQTRAQHILDESARHDIRVVSIFDADYPTALRSIPEQPPIIYVKGQLPSRRAVACIGTREPTRFGQVVTDKLVEALVADNWTIVSGLADGIATLSHQAALRHGGTTIAVMTAGLYCLYPRQTTRLANAILERGGALISAHPPKGARAGHEFIEGIRLQSGLSMATFVMQTDITGDSVHAVRFTLEQNRLLFAPIPYGQYASEPKSRGILAMTTFPASKFAQLVPAFRDHKQLFQRSPHTLPATPINGKLDYPSMLDTLNHHLCQRIGEQTKPSIHATAKGRSSTPPKVLNTRQFRQPEHLTPNQVYIGHDPKWGALKWENPFRTPQDGDRTTVIAKFEAWLVNDPKAAPLRDSIDQLRGRDLICHCAPRPCHGDILLKYANRTLAREPNRTSPATASFPAPTTAPQTPTPLRVPDFTIRR